MNNTKIREYQQIFVYLVICLCDNTVEFFIKLAFTSERLNYLRCVQLN